MKTQITPVQQRDAILALLLLLLIVFYFSGKMPVLYCMAGVLALGMIFPALFTPLARFWFWLSHLLGKVTGRVLMALIFCLLVLPVGLARRCLRRDPMALRTWKNGNGSAFVTRDHDYCAEDLNHPY